jgi:hypothetical protein
MPTTSRRPLLAIAAAALAAAAVALPVVGGVLPVAAPAGAVTPAAEDPEATPSPDATEKPGNGPPDDKPDKGPKEVPPGLAGKEDRPVENPVELTGTVGTRTDADGGTEYTLTVNGRVLALEAGPPWFFGDDHPLAPFVGTSVTVEGEQAEGSDTVDAHVVDGTVIREPGRPPWAGGPNAVGEIHPGWKDWKATKGEHEPGSGKPPWAGPKEPEDDETP